MKKPWLTWLIRLTLVLLLPGFWLLTGADIEALLDAASALPVGHLMLAALIVLGSMCVAAIRWRFIMTALGATTRPAILPSIRLYLVTYFYNIFVPGAVGGDILRGILARHHFPNQAASYVVVVLERVIGLVALGFFFLIGVTAGPKFLEARDTLLALGVLSGLGVGLLIAARLSERIYARWRAFPKIEAPGGLLIAFAISFLSHSASIAAFWVLARGLGLPIDLFDLALIVPVAFVAGVVPISIVGVGPREAAMVALLRLFDVGSERALVLSLSFALITILIAGLGGVLQLAGRLTSAGDTSRSSEAAPPRG